MLNSGSAVSRNTCFCFYQNKPSSVLLRKSLNDPDGQNPLKSDVSGSDCGSDVSGSAPVPHMKINWGFNEAFSGCVPELCVSLNAARVWSLWTEQSALSVNVGLTEQVSARCCFNLASHVCCFRRVRNWSGDVTERKCGRVETHPTHSSSEPEQGRG